MQVAENNKITPVTQGERIIILDCLRGIALCGILLMNIPGFALPSGAAFDPTIYNEWGSINLSVYFLIEWIPEGTQRAIFSILFGAGMLIFIDRLEKKTKGTIAAEIYMRRQLWLLLFGLINAFILLWHWDILYAYAICGILIMPFRRLKPKYLFIAAFVALLIITTRETKHLFEEKAIIRKGEAIARLDTTMTKWTSAQQVAWNEMNEFKTKSDTASKRKKAREEVQKMLGTYGSIYDLRSDMSVKGETRFMYYYAIWDILLCMFIGMAFFKLGILHGNAPIKWYWLMAIFGWIIGLSISWFRLENYIRFEYNQFEWTKNTLFDGYELSRLFRAMGMLGTLLLLYRVAFFAKLMRVFRPVGQMAFTNYLMQSILCGLFFYGIGLGYFGKLERYEIYFVVFAVWLFQIIISHIWMHYFRFGPFEWLWRTLTYWKRQPFRRNTVLSPEVQTAT